jgi:uncharacterized protein (TIGR04255 family)
MIRDDLPHFDHPPVVETVLGVQFEPLKGFRNGHLGAFWKRLGPDWPILTDVPPLTPQFERFGETEAWAEAGLQLKLTQEMAARVQITNADRNRMIQVQNGRLHYNWLGEKGDQYPRYQKVRPGFDCALEKFEQFLADERLGTLRPNQWEVTYVNHIPKGTVWNEPQDWQSLFRFPLMPSANAGDLQLESVSGAWHFVIEPRRGRLHAHLQHGRKGGATGEEILVLTLTARGPAGGKDDEQGLALDEGLDCGREAIVKAFAELTSEKAHEYWGLVHEHA